MGTQINLYQNKVSGVCMVTGESVWHGDWWECVVTGESVWHVYKYLLIKISIQAYLVTL